MDGLISHVYPAIAGLPLAGAAGLAEPERLLQLRADAVVVAFNQAEQLRQDGFTRLAETRFDSRRPIDSRLETWSRVGAALGDSGRTASLSRKFQDDLAAVARQCPPGVPPPRAVFINMTAGYWALAGSNYYGAYRIAAAGGINAAAALRTFDRENLEQLLLLDPDIILFTANTSDQAITREVLADPVFRVLRAVRDRRFYQFPEHAFMNELVEDRILLTWLAEVFYLDALPRRTRQVFKETYREVYGYELSEAEIDRALFMETNRGAFGYERFAAASPETGKQP
jgi:iron complex transport system substrate-binding protein